MKKKTAIFALVIMGFGTATYPWWSLIIIDQIYLQPHAQILNHPVQERQTTVVASSSDYSTYSVMHPFTYSISSEWYTPHPDPTANQLGTYSQVFYDADNQEQLQVTAYSLSDSIRYQPDCPDLLFYTADYDRFSPLTVNPFAMRNLAKQLILKSISFPVTPETVVYQYPTDYSYSAAGSATGATFVFISPQHTAIERSDCGFRLEMYLSSSTPISVIDRLVSSINSDL